MRLWMLALICLLVMLGCVVAVWIGAVRQSSKSQGKLRNAVSYTLILLVLAAAALRSNLPWDNVLSPTAVIMLLILAGGLLAAMYAASLRMRKNTRPAHATNPPIHVDDESI